jgi:site-specific DNA recombinase
MRRTSKRRPKPQRLTVAYLRCSTVEQAVLGSSIQTQRARCEGYAAATERTIAREFIDDGYSGSSLDRPAMQALLAAIGKGEIGCVIAGKLDRYSRNLADTLRLIALAEKHGVELCSAAESLDTSTASGKMFVNVSGSFAQFERDRIAERTSEALAVKRNAHTVYGPTPFGYAREGSKLVPIPREQNALTMMRSMHDAGNSLRAIGDALTSAGYVPPKGASWHANTVRRILGSKMTAETAA